MDDASLPRSWVLACVFCPFDKSQEKIILNFFPSNWDTDGFFGRKSLY
jgi:hypothetical protein